MTSFSPVRLNGFERAWPSSSHAGTYCDMFNPVRFSAVTVAPPPLRRVRRLTDFERADHFERRKNGHPDIETERVGTKRDIWTSLPLKLLTEPTAIAVLGTNRAKLLVVNPKKPNSNGKSYFADRKYSRETALSEIEEDLKIYAVKPKNFRAVATSNLIPTVDIESPYWRNIKVLGRREEAEYIYKSIIRGILKNRQDLSRERFMILEIGGESTQLASGVGKEFDPDRTKTLQIGSTTCVGKNSNPFSPNVVNMARKEYRKRFNTINRNAFPTLENNNTVFMNFSELFELFRNIHLKATNNREDIFKSSLTSKTVEHYLTKDGLETLKSKGEESGADTVSLSSMVKKLIVLSELLKALEVKEIRFTATEGLKAEVLEQFMYGKIRERMSGYVDRLHSKFENNYKCYRSQFSEILLGNNEYGVEITDRAKDPVSILDKLLNRIKKGEIKAIDNIYGAERAIMDGVGYRLILPKDPLKSKKAIDVIVNNLLKAMREGKITVKEVENYRGEGVEPYFESNHIEAFRELIRKKGVELKISDSKEDGAVKKSGYTSVNLNIIFHSDKKNSFLNHPHMVEVQIKGPYMNQFCQVEHLLYDIREGKDVTKGIPKIEELVKPIQTLLRNLSGKEFDKYSDYIREHAKYARDLELGRHSSVKRPDFQEFTKQIKPIPKEEIDILKFENIQKIQKMRNFILGHPLPENGHKILIKS